MLCENIWGNLKDIDTTGKKIDYVEFEWDEAFKRIHKKVSRAGKEVGIRLDDSVLTKGIRTGDILWQEGDEVLAAEILPCKVIEVKLTKGHEKMAAKVCYEVGTPYFCGERRNRLSSLLTHSRYWKCWKKSTA